VGAVESPGASGIGNAAVSSSSAGRKDTDGLVAAEVRITTRQVMETIVRPRVNR
jgi:hypothetical protein